MGSLFNLSGSKPRSEAGKAIASKAAARKPGLGASGKSSLFSGGLASSALKTGADGTKMSDETFERLRKFIYDKCGIYFTDNKKYLLEGRISKRLIAKKLRSYDEYVDYLTKTENRVEIDDLFQAITINETFFYRAQQQYEAFEKILVPEIIKRKVANGETKPTIRIWSAASSSGEEAYTLALIIRDRLRYRHPNVSFQIFASDIDNGILEKARAAKYKDYAIRNVPKSQLDTYFTKEGNLYVLKNEVKRIVRFSQVNLFDSAAMRKIVNTDVIFCANVLIYFDTKAKQKVVSHLFNSLNKGGYLFIGYSESLHGVSKAFKLIHLPKSMAYYKE